MTSTLAFAFGEEGIARGYGDAAVVALHAPGFRAALAARRLCRLRDIRALRLDPLDGEVSYLRDARYRGPRNRHRR